MFIRRLILPALAACGIAHAVERSANGYGQALIFPYYTVRSTPGGELNTYLSITNAGREKAVKLRFREGTAGAHVFELNLYLSPGDMWTGALVPDPAGVRLISADKSCTNPEIPAGGLVLAPPPIDDGQGSEIDRSREGYVEALTMASFNVPTALAIDERLCNGLLRDDSATLDGMVAPDGGLAGSGTLIDVRSARTFSYAATALESLASRAYFSQPYNRAAFPGTFFTSTFESSAIDPVSVVRIRDTIYRSTWRRGVDAVSAVLEAGSLDGEFVLDPATASKTDWIVTMPTRNAYVRPGLPGSPPFVPEAPDARCGGVHVFAGSRDQTSVGDEVSFGVPTPGTPLLCWSANVYSFRKDASAAGDSSSVVGSRNTKLFRSPTAENGWAWMQPTGFVLAPLSTTVFSGRTGTTAQIDPRPIGMPAIGLSLSTYDNGFLNCSGIVCKGNFGTAVPLRNRPYN